LLAFFEQTAGPYLSAASDGRSPLASEARARAIFRDLRVRLDPTAHEVVARLETLCDHRRQFGLQARLDGWLKGWLSVHVPLSVSLCVLSGVHVIMAVIYH
jgi:hypothetical protein